MRAISSVTPDLRVKCETDAAVCSGQLLPAAVSSAGRELAGAYSFLTLRDRNALTRNAANTSDVQERGALVMDSRVWSRMLRATVSRRSGASYERPIWEESSDDFAPYVNVIHVP